MRVVGDVSTASEALVTARREHPDLIVLAQELRDIPFDKIITELRERSAETRIVVIADVLDPGVVLAMRKLPPSGYIEWTSLQEDALLPMLQSVRSGYWVLSEDAEHIIDEHKARPTTEGAIHLNWREEYALRRLMAGASQKQIAGELGLKERAMRTIVRHIKDALDCETPGALTCEGLALGYEPELTARTRP